MKRRGSFPNLLFSTIALATGFFSGGCVTKPMIAPQITSTVVAHHVSVSTVNKIQTGQMLNYDDIQHLVQSEVPAAIVISYLRSTEGNYQLSPGQLDSLKVLGASAQLINYLNESKGFYASDASIHSSRQLIWKNLWNKFVTRSSLFKSQSRVVENASDPAYEESLYSPFLL